jgi:putative transposase
MELPRAGSAGVCNLRAALHPRVRGASATVEIRRAFKERLYPNKEQEKKLLWTLDQCRALYNAAIEQRRHVWESYLTGQHLVPVPFKPEGRKRRTPRPLSPAQQKRQERGEHRRRTAPSDGFMHRQGISYAEQCHDLVDLRVGFPDFKGVNTQIQQNVCKRVDLAYQAYFDRRADYAKQCKARKARGEKLEPSPAKPFFRNRRSYSSFTYPNPLQGWKLEHGGRGPFPVRCPDAPRIPRSTARRELNRSYGKLVLSNIGAITVRWSRPIEGTIKTVTIRRDGPEWYVIFSCVLEVEQRAQPQRPAAALDVGLESYAMFDDGNRIENPRYYRRNEATLARRQRIVSTKVEAHKSETKAGKGSSLAAEPLRSKSDALTGARRTNNLARARAQVAKIHRKAQRRREYFHHKRAKELVARVGAIGVEALSINNMVRRPKPKLAPPANGSGGSVPKTVESSQSGERRSINDAAVQPVYAPNGASAKSGLNKSINDAAWGTFLFILEYKATAAGVTFVKVDPRGTSQICSRCRKEVPKTLAERWHICPQCGLIMPRDQNSACEIYQRAGFGIPPALADSGSSRPSPGNDSAAAR